jgi:hypothetical protein
MTRAEQPLPSGGHNRELLALEEIEHTRITPRTAAMLTFFFLAAIGLVPVLEIALVPSRGQESIQAAWAHLAGIPSEVNRQLSDDPPRTLWNRVVRINHIAQTALSGFEVGLENESFIARTLRPPAQFLLTRWLGAGNERVYPGRERWLFYRSDVEHVTMPPFLDHDEMQRRVDDAPEWTDPPQPDPRLALTRFRDDLARRGIALILVPIPLKPTIHPEMLVRGYADAENARSPENPSYRAFIENLEETGFLVVNPGNALTTARASGPQYLATDTHWRPESMETIAQMLASFIRNQKPLPAVQDPGYRIERREIRNTGDVARMLDLPGDARLFPPEDVWIRRVLAADGSLWRAYREADVLVLGDSFSNIFSLESMGWGTSAGFVEQLSYELSRPLDRLVQNDQGAFATRAILQRDPSRLSGKRLVVYQFAVRELTHGDWKVLPLPSP